MSSLNKVILIGNLGADPEKKYTGTGQAVCNFRIATSARWTDKQGNKQERTEWHRIVVYGPQAENCEKYLSKGRPVCVEGEIRTRSWDDKDGVKKYMTEIIAQRVQFLGGAPGGTRTDRPTATKPAGDDSFPAEPAFDESGAQPQQEDDIPF